MTSSSVIVVDGLTKSYGGTLALDSLSLEVPRGSIFGLIGTNGAGKTTAFKCMLGMARPDAGSVSFDGEALSPEMFNRLAYLPERPALYEWMTCNDHLELTRRSFASYDTGRAKALLEKFDLDPRKRTSSLSKGQQSALALILAFATKPEIMVLDEPSSGLDPVHQRQVLDLIIGDAAGGSTIIFSSHQIGQVERAADRVAILHRGKLVLQGVVDELKGNEKIIEATFATDAPPVNGLAEDPAVRRVVRNGRLLRAYLRHGGSDVERRIQALSPVSLRVLDQGLEDIFLQAVED
jgi:ABC-2 type transport system ATP-binding protein